MTKDNSEVSPSQSQDTPADFPEQNDVTAQPSPSEPEPAAEVLAETSKPSEPERSEEAPQVAASDLRQRKALFDEDEYSDEEYEDMLSMYEDTLKNIEEGEIVKAKVLRVTDSAAILDLGFKSEGSVPLEEFRVPGEVEPGQEVDVFLEKLEDTEGVVVLSKKKADFLRVWEQIKTSFDADEPIRPPFSSSIPAGHPRHPRGPGPACSVSLSALR